MSSTGGSRGIERFPHTFTERKKRRGGTRCGARVCGHTSFIQYALYYYLGRIDILIGRGGDHSLLWLVGGRESRDARTAAAYICRRVAQRELARSLHHWQSTARRAVDALVGNMELEAGPSSDEEDDEKRLRVGSRWFIPSSTFPGFHQNKPKLQQRYGRGWLATVIAIEDDQITYHCDGDMRCEYSIADLDEFVEDFEYVASEGEPPHPLPEAPTPQGMDMSRCERNPLCTRGSNHGGRGGSCSLKRPVAESSTAALEAQPANNKNVDAPGRCEKNALCTRGFKHGGWGGRCSFKRPPAESPSATLEAAPVVIEDQDGAECMSRVADDPRREKLPPGWHETRVSATASSHSYLVITHGSGMRVRSRKEAWRIHDHSGESLKTPTSGPPVAKAQRPMAKPLTNAMQSSATRVRTPGVRLADPNPEDDKVGRDIKIYLADDGGVWRTAKILTVTYRCDWGGTPQKAYGFRFDKDGKQYEALLDKPCDDPENYEWRYLSSDDELDEPDEGVESREVHPAVAAAAPPQRREAVLVDSGPRKRPCRPQVEHPLSASRDASPWTATMRRPQPADVWRPHDPVSQCVEDAIEAVLARARDAAATAADDLRVMRKLRTCEWFAGSARLSFALHALGCEVKIHDRNPDVIEWEAHDVQPADKMICSDEFLSIRLTDLLMEPPYDYMHFSIDCSSFTGLSHAGQGRNEGNDFLGDSTQAQDGNKLVSKTFDIIAMQLERKRNFLFTIENPFSGRMKQHPRVPSQLEVPVENGGLGATRVVVDYCRFWDGKGQRPFHKRTIIWTNSPALIREFGKHAPQRDGKGPISHFLCEKSTPCQFYGPYGHRSVYNKTTREATPFPSLLAWRIAQAVTIDLSPERWKSLSEPAGVR